MNTRDVDGRSMMLAAAEEGHLQVVQHLVRHANKQLIMAVDAIGRSPVFVAAQGGHVATLEVVAAPVLRSPPSPPHAPQVPCLPSLVPSASPERGSDLVFSNTDTCRKILT